MLEDNLLEVTLSNVIEPQRWTELLKAGAEDLQQALPSKLFQNFRISAWQSRYLRQFIQCKHQPTMETNRKDFKIQKNFALSWRIRTATIKTCRASKPPYPECFNWKSGQKVSGQKNKIPFTGPSGWDRCQPHRLKAVTKSGEELLCVNPDKHLAWAKQQNDGELENCPILQEQLKKGM